MKKFTETERIIALETQYRYKWIARDKDGDLHLFTRKPSKDEEEGTWYLILNEDDGAQNIVDFPFNGSFNAIEWEDDEPINMWSICDEPFLSGAEKNVINALLQDSSIDEDCIMVSAYTPTDGKRYETIRVWDTQIVMTFAGDFAGLLPDGEYTLRELIEENLF